MMKNKDFTCPNCGYNHITVEIRTTIEETYFVSEDGKWMSVPSTSLDKIESYTRPHIINQQMLAICQYCGQINAVKVSSPIADHLELGKEIKHGAPFHREGDDVIFD